MATQTISIEQFDWTVQPAAAEIAENTLDEFCRHSDFLRSLAAAMLHETGTRLCDWIDHFSLRELPASAQQLGEAGFEIKSVGGTAIVHHSRGMFAPIMIDLHAPPRVAIKVESVTDFLFAHHMTGAAPITGEPMSRLRHVVVDRQDEMQVWAVERHGYRGFDIVDATPETIAAVSRHSESFLLRQRNWPTESEGFAHTRQLIASASRDMGTDLACDLFFAAERRYWQSRNRAARVQKARQDQLGLGWANHDHHTYRSSREHFTQLIAALEALGFECRERFYGGHGAGWGAQVLEQPNCGIVIFADVDMTPDEVTGDFAHEGLAPRDQLGTVGLWCKLHGEAFLQAGLHHLECQFDFDAARQQLAREGVNTMAPFTDFPHLKQAFTAGENWPVAPSRIDAARRAGFITSEQAEKFRTSGALGSHLEILERNAGYKGFNQTGISEIIRDTDPRRQATN